MYQLSRLRHLLSAITTTTASKIRNRRVKTRARAVVLHSPPCCLPQLSVRSREDLPCFPRSSSRSARQTPNTCEERQDTTQNLSEAAHWHTLLKQHGHVRASRRAAATKDSRSEQVLLLPRHVGLPDQIDVCAFAHGVDAYQPADLACHCRAGDEAS